MSMRIFYPIALLLAFSFVTLAQSLGSGTVILGAGGAFPGSGYRTFPFHTGTSVTGEYELGLHRFLAATVGLDNFTLNLDNYSRTSTVTTRERITLLPFGLRAIAPVASG